MLDALAARLKALREAETVPVWPEHWHAVQVFRLMGTQWRVIPVRRGAMWTGLVYSSLDHPLAAAREIVEPERQQSIAVVLSQLRALERAAMNVLNRT